MKKHKYLNKFLALLSAEKIITAETKPQFFGHIPLIFVQLENWGSAFKTVASYKYRFAGIWAADLNTQIQLTACVEFGGFHFLLRTLLDTNQPNVFSVTPFYPGANRPERHTHDMFGVIFVDHPDQRRWTRHKAWQGNQFPLRKNFTVDFVLHENEVTPPDIDYDFIKVRGAGTYEIPVGPVHAGIIEPGHFRFQAAGEDVINLEERLGYVHKGIEKIAEGRTIESLIRLAGCISGDSTVAYAWAACRAYENAYAIEIPKRALFLRAIMVERERIANHLGDFAAICNDVGFAFPYYQFMRLKELWLRMNAQIFGHRFMKDLIVAKGVAVDLDDAQKVALQKQINEFRKELDELYPMIENNSSLHDRLKTTGKLPLENVNQLGVLGPIARASGCKFDLRRDSAYAPYDQIKLRIPIYNTGDVLARTRIRAQEILATLELLENLLAKLPGGVIHTPWDIERKAGEGIGLVEGWRGEILVYLSFAPDGLVTRFFPRDPSWFSWPALEKLIHGNIVPDFPVCNKSINGSYSGVDL